MSKVQEILKKVYFDIENSPVAFASARKVYEFLNKELNLKVKFSDIKDFERRYVFPNQIIRNRRLKEVRPPYFASGLDHTWQLDLIDLHAHPNSKLGRFVLSKVDIFSRQADAEVITSKSAVHVLNGLKKIIERGKKPHNIQTDQGTEFFNKIFSSYCESNAIKHYRITTDLKGSLIERFNRTFQSFFYKYRLFFPKKTNREITRLVIKNYNKRIHSSLGFAPIRITEDNNGAILSKLIDHRIDTARNTYFFRKPFSVKVGDKVRLSGKRTAFSKDYRGTFTGEVFEVYKRFRRYPRFDINLYKVKDLSGELVEGSFTQSEIQKVILPPSPRIGKEIARKGKQIFKQLADYPEGVGVWIKRK